MCSLEEPKARYRLEGTGSWVNARRGQDKTALMGKSERASPAATK